MMRRPRRMALSSDIVRWIAPRPDVEPFTIVYATCRATEWWGQQTVGLGRMSYLKTIAI